ncbi:porphobilinogen synthase [Flavobacterium sp. CS20]|uniref:porphobilinogen synthase n=1 Tax=Flavobacterium sp. CS20 TaxID=2775246 RepID=UPI001B3A692A|nr:porphobilinogen synthase [Flavobacterium sp. CS20]QTY26559.1 porphobilinogen synthase [Flavobacterium sp. CS20]
MYPYQRPRRLRKSQAIRDLVQENRLHPDDFIVPLFIVEGQNIKEEIPSMPNYYRMSLDLIKQEVRDLWAMGLKSVLLFVKVDDKFKDNTGLSAIDDNGLMQQAIKSIKDTVPEMYVMTDVALDPFSSLGHDGIVKNGKIINDESVQILAKMALSHTQAGADMVAPSDMMDGRIGAIREILEKNGFDDTGILSYSAKYASAFYGPFRDALDSAPVDEADVPKDKSTYQMNSANRKEAITETLLDIEEGADIVMVKPGLCYLDIVRDLANTIEQPIAVYQVSGEYAMIKAASQQGWLDHDAVMIEQLTAFKRAGASLIASYFARDVVRLLS